MQRLKREIDYVLPDDAFVPELQYQYNAKGKDLFAIGGDSFFGFQLPSARSILFEVAVDHLGRGRCWKYDCSAVSVCLASARPVREYLPEC